MRNRKIPQYHLDRIGRNRDDLQRLADDLRDYCHVVGCAATDECPEWHSACKPWLGLDTSIAWTVSAQLSECAKILDLVVSNRRIDRAVLITLLSECGRLEVLRFIIERHHIKYAALHVQLNRAMTSLRLAEIAAKEVAIPALNQTETKIVEDLCTII